MAKGYSNNTSIQMLIALLKAHGIKKVIVSPGTCNLEFVASLQYDGDFQLFSAVDERGASYMACGMATECNEPVVITCTEATASRDYLPGLTEAYYRNLPILVITGLHKYYDIGNLLPQVIDRSVSPVDTFISKYRLPVIKDRDDEYKVQMMLNEALLDLEKPISGPVHIDLPIRDCVFLTENLPVVRVVDRYYVTQILPKLPSKGKIAIFIGTHSAFSDKEIDLIDSFCEIYNAVAFCDHTSGYNGHYAVHSGIIAIQKNSYSIFRDIIVLIHIGGPTGDGNTMNKLKGVNEVWRVSPDGKLKDTFLKLTKVFAFSTEQFFTHYVSNRDSVSVPQNSFFAECMELKHQLLNKMIEYPFSNLYIASKLTPLIPKNSVVHLGVSNTIRAWTLFDFDKSVYIFSNVGCRGIDGALSSCIGAAIANPNKIHFCILGDLSFFYDINSLGNREIHNNIRILLINNNGGNIFKHTNHPAYRNFGDEVTGMYIAASGHFGNQSHVLVKHFAEDLGYVYLCANNKHEFDQVCTKFVDVSSSQKMIFEVFTNDEDERQSFEIAETLDVSSGNLAKGLAKNAIKRIVGEKGLNAIEKAIK